MDIASHVLFFMHNGDVGHQFGREAVAIRGEFVSFRIVLSDNDCIPAAVP